MNNIFTYVMRREATEDKLISGVECSADTALEEFKFVKHQFHKEDGRQYYHIVQSFDPEDDLTPETAHEIGLRFAEYFPGYQIVVATHVNTGSIHNHLVMNSVSYEDGKKFHQTRDELLDVKEYSNRLCLEYGLSITEPKTEKYRRAKWKQDLIRMAQYALTMSYCKEDFIEFMREHGYDVHWEDEYKYITFTTPEGYKIRDSKLFDERLLKNNLEIYFTLGGADSLLSDTYCSYRTPQHGEAETMTITTGLVTLLGNILSAVPQQGTYTPQRLTERSQQEKMRLERLLGRKISNEAFACYCTQEEYDQQQGIGMYL